MSRTGSVTGRIVRRESETMTANSVLSSGRGALHSLRRPGLSQVGAVRRRSLRAPCAAARARVGSIVHRVAHRIRLVLHSVDPTTTTPRPAARPTQAHRAGVVGAPDVPTRHPRPRGATAANVARPSGIVASDQVPRMSLAGPPPGGRLENLQLGAADQRWPHVRKLGGNILTAFCKFSSFNEGGPEWHA